MTYYKFEIRSPKFGMPMYYCYHFDTPLSIGEIEILKEEILADFVKDDSCTCCGIEITKDEYCELMDI